MNFLPGQILAFSGKGVASRVIQARTFSKISHIGIVYDADTIVESTSLRGFTGVVRHSINDVYGYKGKIWLLDIHPTLREKGLVSNVALQEFLDEQVGKKYDYKQAALSGMDLLDWLGLFKAKDNNGLWFCSEIAQAALEHWSPVLFRDKNESEATPKDIWKMDQWASRVRIL